jgi:hypothetical protein
MTYLKLKTCPCFGPTTDRQSEQALPTDYKTQPFKYLPSRITLSETELELARRYAKGDMSGGYIASQIAYFRSGPSEASHQQRRERFQLLQIKVKQLRLVLPSAYVELIESDDFMARLRHNTIWLYLPDEICPFPPNPDYKLFQIAEEAQGCDFWYLLLAPDGGHVVTYSQYGFGHFINPSSDNEQDVDSVEIYQCAESFEAWIVNYFAECIEEDRHYKEMLKKYPGM